uniref:Probable G-protein coupled receptor 19 n=1 Tax=Athene cunicularia TaxID=194338 RepID=A0A663M811_ATHCN
MVAHSMANSTAPVLLPTLLLLLQNKTYPETSTPPAAYEGTGSPMAPRSGGNHTALLYDLRLGEIAAAAMVWAVLWLVSIFGNSLICLVIHCSRKTPSTTNYFVVSMACADLLLSIVSVPFVLLHLTYGSWMLGTFICKLVRYVQYLTPAVQINVLLCISVDGFYAVIYPLRFKVSREKLLMTILASWFLGAAFAAPAFTFYSSSSDHHCPFFPPGSWQGAAYGITHLLVVFLIPASIIIILYQRIIMYIRRAGMEEGTVRKTMDRKVKTTKMFLVLNMVFLLAWLPFYVIQLWHPKETDGSKSSLVFLAITWLSFSCSAAKPVIYFIYKSNFRRGMMELCCMSTMKYYRNHTDTTTTCSGIAKKNHIGIVNIVAPDKTVPKDSIYEVFIKAEKENCLAC